MVKHSQTICRQQPTNSLSVFNHFVGLTLKWLVKTKETSELLVFTSLVILCTIYDDKLTSQTAITCLETLEQGVKYVHSYQ